MSAGIDMALHLAARFAGDEAARSVQFAIEYDPEPPAGPLDWASAPRQTWAGHAATILNTALADHAPDLHTRLAGRL